VAFIKKTIPCSLRWNKASEVTCGRGEIMNRNLSLLSAAGIGAGLMYLFDPSRGKRRRALLANKITHAGKVASNTTVRTGRDIRNRVQGLVAEVQSLLQTTEVSDQVLQARVRSKLGRVVSHPGAIDVKAENGDVVLSGPILAAEEHPLIDAVFHVGGVKNIENLLELRESVWM